MDIFRLSASDFLERIETAEEWEINIFSEPDGDEVMLNVEKNGRSESFLGPNSGMMSPEDLEQFKANIKNLMRSIVFGICS